MKSTFKVTLRLITFQENGLNNFCFSFSLLPPSPKKPVDLIQNIYRNFSCLIAIPLVVSAQKGSEVDICAKEHFFKKADSCFVSFIEHTIGNTNSKHKIQTLNYTQKTLFLYIWSKRIKKMAVIIILEKRRGKILCFNEDKQEKH